MSDNAVHAPERLRSAVEDWIDATTSCVRAWSARHLDPFAEEIGAVSDAAREIGHAASSPEAWETPDSVTRSLERVLGETAERVVAPLETALSELALGDGLGACFSEVAGAAAAVWEDVETQPIDPSVEDEAAGPQRAFARSIALETLPDSARTFLRHAATGGLEPISATASRLTDWVHTIWNAQERVRTAEWTEGGQVPGRAQVEQSAEAWVAALEALEAWARSGPLDGVAEPLGSAFESQAGSFAPSQRKWRHAAAALAKHPASEEEPAGGTPPCQPARFASEAGRVQLAGHLLRFDAFLASYSQGILLSPALEAIREVCAGLKVATESLGALAVEAATAFDEAENGAEAPDLRRMLRRARAALAEAQHGLSRVLSDHRIPESMVDALRRLMLEVSELPSALQVSPLQEGDDEPKLDAAPSRLDVRTWAEETFHAYVLDQLVRCDEVYLDALRVAEAAFPRSRDILEYNLGAACEPADLPADAQEDLQRELATSGLTRAADRLVAIRERLEAARLDGGSEPARVLRETRRRFRERAMAEGGLEGHARDAWGSMRRRGLKTRATAADRIRHARRRVMALVRLGARKASGVLRATRATLGTVPIDEARAEGTTKALASIDAAADQLPFVYRRLFSYGPLDDPSLLIGREVECAALDRLLAHWENGSSDGGLLVGTSGVGLTSLLHTTQERWSGRVDWRPVTLDGRIEREEELAALLGRALDVSPQPVSLAELESALTARGHPAVAPVCAIENLEHLYFRGVMAAGLISPALKLIAATDSSVFWLASLSASAWEVVRATDPGLAALMRVFHVSTLGRAAIESVILTRHERSGISLVFEEPDTLPMGVRRQLGRRVDSEERERILETAYFDRLFELSEGYVALALLYWLRSVHADSEGESIRVRWPEPLDFAVWDELEADAGFALRAFLEHGSLTLSEYSRLFGASETSAFATFERLGSLLIIEPLGYRRRVGSPLSFQRVRATDRYRIRPVLIRPVERLLEGRRLLY